MDEVACSFGDVLLLQPESTQMIARIIVTIHLFIPAQTPIIYNFRFAFDFSITFVLYPCKNQYGRKIPKHAHGTANLDRQTSSTKLIVEAVMALFDRIMDPKLLARRIPIDDILHINGKLFDGIETGFSF